MKWVYHCPSLVQLSDMSEVDCLILRGWFDLNFIQISMSLSLFSEYGLCCCFILATARWKN